MDKLRTYRESLYAAFDRLVNMQDVFDFQQLIALELLRAERGIREAVALDDYQDHRNMVYSVADALAWRFLHSFTIRQLGQYESRCVALLSQEHEFNDMLSHYRPQAQSSIFLFSDLARCITVGDAIEVKDPEDIVIHEWKSSAPDDISMGHLLSGRLGRQFSRNLWLTQYLKKGIGKLFGSAESYRVIEVPHPRSSYIRLLPDLIDKCLVDPQHVASMKVEKGLTFVAQHLDHPLDPEGLEIPEPRGLVLLAASSRLVEEVDETVYHLPIMAFPIALKHRILLTERDVIVIGFVSVGYINEVASELGYHFSAEKGQGTLHKADKSFSISPRFVNDILFGYQPVREVIQEVIYTIESVLQNAGQMEQEHKAYIAEHPTDKEQLAQFAQGKFTLERVGKKLIIKQGSGI